jgi:hypothetical protein
MIDTIFRSRHSVAVACLPADGPRHHGRSADAWFIVAGYSALAVIALAALLMASGGPGNDEAALAIMAAMP